MYAGEMVERAPVTAVFDHPQHPYTQGADPLCAQVRADKASSILYPIRGRVPHQIIGLAAASSHHDVIM